MDTYDRRSTKTKLSRLGQFHGVGRIEMRKLQRRTAWIAPVLAFGFILSGCSFMNWFDDGSVIAQTSALPYAVVDTNQSKTYGNTSVIGEPDPGSSFFGKDAQVDG